MVKAAVAYVVGPTVAADNPNAAGNQAVGQSQQIPRRKIRCAGQRLAQLLDAMASMRDPRVVLFAGGEEIVGKVWPDPVA